MGGVVGYSCYDIVNVTEFSLEISIFLCCLPMFLH